METRKEEIKDKVKAEWKRNPDIRAEFSEDFDAYLAYRLAETNNQIKQLGK